MLKLFLILIYSDKALFNVGGEYQGNGSVVKPSPEVYWLNNFDNIYQSYSEPFINITCIYNNAFL